MCFAMQLQHYYISYIIPHKINSYEAFSHSSNSLQAVLLCCHISWLVNTHQSNTPSIQNTNLKKVNIPPVSSSRVASMKTTFVMVFGWSNFSFQLCQHFFTWSKCQLKSYHFDPRCYEWENHTNVQWEVRLGGKRFGKLKRNT